MTPRVGWFPRVLLVNFLQSVTMQGIRPMISYRALSLGATAGEIGLVAACFGFLALIVAIPAGRWIDRLGEARFLIAGTAVIATVSLALTASNAVFLLAIAMLALGGGQIIAAAAIQTMVANAGATEGRDSRFGTQTVVASLGQLLGPAIAGVIVAGSATVSTDQSGHLPVSATDGVFLFGAGAAGLACVVALSLVKWPPTERERRDVRADDAPSTLQAVRRVVGTASIPQAMLASLAVLSSLDILVVYLPVYGVLNGIPVATIGALLALRGGASIGGRALMTPLMAKLGRRRLLIACMVGPALTFLALPAAGDNVAVLAGLTVVIGFGLGLSQPLTVTWIASQSPVEIRGTAFAIRLSANRFGQFAIPAGAGVVAGVAGVSMVFWILGALLALSAMLVTRGAFDAAGERPRTAPA